MLYRYVCGRYGLYVLYALCVLCVTGGTTLVNIATITNTPTKVFQATNNIMKTVVFCRVVLKFLVRMPRVKLLYAFIPLLNERRRILRGTIEQCQDRYTDTFLPPCAMVPIFIKVMHLPFRITDATMQQRIAVVFYQTARRHFYTDAARFCWSDHGKCRPLFGPSYGPH